jgi:hypothetical protein
MRAMKRIIATVLLTGGFIVGCEATPAVVPQSDPALKKTSAQYAADAVKHFPFKSSLPASDEQPVRAMPDYSLDFIDLTNLSKHDLLGPEVWINRQYEMTLPSLKAGEIKRLNFRMFYDDRGDHFPLNNDVQKGGVIIRQLEVIVDGKIYQVPVRLGL